MKLELKRPCADCPFRSDKPHQRGWLGKRRAEQIIHAITVKDGTFQCHKTLDLPSEDAQHCGGATILLEHIDNPNQWMRIAERIGHYDRNRLVMDSQVFETPEQFIRWHAGETVVTTLRKFQSLREERQALIDSHADVSDWTKHKEKQMQNFLERLGKDGIKPEIFQSSESLNA